MVFWKHQESKIHHEAVEAIVILPKTASDVGELRNKAHKAEKENAQGMRYFAHQDLAQQGSRHKQWIKLDSAPTSTGWRQPTALELAAEACKQIHITREPKWNADDHGSKKNLVSIHT